MSTLKERCYTCNPPTKSELKEWRHHSGFNAYRYGIDKFKTVKPEPATADDVLAYLEWERAWSANGVPG